MLSIRKEQMVVFREPAVNDFVKRVMVHLNKCFPAKCEAMGEAKVRAMVKYGSQRAVSYRVSSERDVCKYIDLMLVFGQDFDQDPKLPWASSILNNQAIINPTTKVARLYKAAKKQEKQKGGEAARGQQ